MTAMTANFDALPWHDAVLLRIHVDRSTPGTRDEVVLDVEWPDGSRQKVGFTDCYRADLALNFGVLASESIREGMVLAGDPDLAEVRQKWARLGVDLSDLKLFRVATNSTASEIRIFARSFYLGL